MKKRKMTKNDLDFFVFCAKDVGVRLALSYTPVTTI